MNNKQTRHTACRDDGKPRKRFSTYKAGLLSGVFDPIHIGHLNIANQAADILQLDRVYFAPTGIPPHKKKAGASAHDRFIMTMMALLDNPRFKVSDVEMQSDSTSYTMDTVKNLKKTLRGELYFIMGLDAFEDIHNWKDAEKLIKSCNFAVMPRFGQNARESVLGLERHFLAKKEKVSFTTGKTDNSREILRVTGSRYKIHLCPSLQIDISSTLLKRKVKNRESIKYLVPGPVEQYITKMGLYTK